MRKLAKRGYCEDFDAAEEISSASYDTDPRCQQLAQQYNQGDGKANGVCADEADYVNKAADSNATTADDVAAIADKLPRIEVLAAEEISSTSYDTDPRCQQLAQQYNQMCKVLAENEKESVKACITNEANPNLGKTLLQGKVNEILTIPQSHPTHDGPASKDRKHRDEMESNAQRSGQPSDSNPNAKVENKDVQATETKGQMKSKPVAEQATKDVEMDEAGVDANTDFDRGQGPATDGSMRKES